MGKMVTVELDEALATRMEARVASGSYATLSDVVDEALAALERREAATTAKLKAMIAESDADERPDRSLEDVLGGLGGTAEALDRN